MPHQGCFQRSCLVALFRYNPVCLLSLCGVIIRPFSAFHLHVFAHMQGTRRQPPYHPLSYC